MAHSTLEPDAVQIFTLIAPEWRQGTGCFSGGPQPRHGTDRAGVPFWRLALINFSKFFQKN